MSDEERLHLYDEVVSTIFDNLTHAHYRNGGLAFADFDPSNKEMMCFFTIATFGYWQENPYIYLEMKLGKYLLFKLTHRKLWKQLRRYTKNVDVRPFEFKEISDHIKNFFNLGDDLLVKVYEEYYEKKN